jgi:TIR domain
MVNGYVHVKDPFLFVSHVSEDRAEAMEIVAALERRNIRCWIAPRDVQPGRPFDDEISAAIDECRAMLLVFSDHCNDSEYIRREVTVAGESQKLVIPFRIENAHPKHGLRVRLADLHWIDGFIAREQAVDAVAQALGLNTTTTSQPADVPPTGTIAGALQERSAGGAFHGPPEFNKSKTASDQVSTVDAARLASAGRDMNSPPMPVGPREEGGSTGIGIQASGKSPARSSKRRPILWAAFAAAGLAVVVTALIVIQKAPPPSPSAEELRTELAAATAEFSCASLGYSVAPDRNVRLSGFAANPGDIDRLRSTVGRISGIGKVVLDVGVRIWPYCEAVAVLQPAVEHMPAPGPSLALVPPGTGAHIGDALVIDIQAPSFDGYMYVDYFADAEGHVIHLLPSGRDSSTLQPQRAHLVLGNNPGARCWTLAGNPGEQQLVTLIATTKPLFPEPRQELDNATDYLPRLTDAINRLPEGSSRAAASLFFQLLDPAPSAARRNECR